MVNSLLLVLQAIALSAIAAVGFAMVFNVPKQHLQYYAILGALGNGLRTLLMQCGVNIEWGSLAAAILIGLIAMLIAEKRKIYSTTISIAATVPMFPGVHAYTGFIALIKIAHHGYTDPLMAEMVTELLKTFFVIGALALGLTIPSVRPFKRKKKLPSVIK